ncbi:MAG: NADH:ubiquinone reductase (Na(+)-transporting) subunit A, partial [Bacteroidales bacterium]|nr:NADH:ubiquinone reductase (Na(+)-transporting) subunit A [Bacteroidales bacterium]
MSNAIKITKGLDLNLYGAPMPEVVETFVSEYALKPKDFIGLIPKLMIEEGERVKAGTPLFYAKGKEKVLFTSPVSGVVKQVKRGAKRVIEEVIISAEETVEYLDFGVSNISELSAEQIKEKLLVSGAWTLLRQRPYSVVPSPDTTPKCIIVSGFSSAPLAPDYSVLLKGLNKELQAGIDVLKKMTGVTIHVNLPAKKGRADELAQLQNAQINTFEGKHPCGNVSVQIEKLDPINKSERVWYLDAQDLVAIGRLFLEGKYDTTRLVALTGQEVSHPQYYKVKRG